MEGDALRAGWASSGALELSGWPDAPPLSPPVDVLERIDALGRSVGVDAFAQLAERAAPAGVRREGRLSCGGTARLVPTLDGWLAVSLARPDDIASVPAWLEVGPDIANGDPWAVVEAELAARHAGELVDRAALVGLPVSRLGEAARHAPVTATEVGSASPRDAPLVVDLSSLWAGPLCARVLRRHGARTVKVESAGRPDGARLGSPSFFEQLNEGTAFEAIDLRAQAGLDRLRSLVRSADVVIEASRPRALEQLGIDAAELVAQGPTVWVSITGYGRTGAGRNRVAFGDDAAVAGGLVALDPERGPCFAADAVADPLSGLWAARATIEALSSGGRWLLDVSMSGVAAAIAGNEQLERWTRVRDPC